MSLNNNSFLMFYVSCWVLDSHFVPCLDFYSWPLRFALLSAQTVLKYIFVDVDPTISTPIQEDTVQTIVTLIQSFS